MKVVRQWMTKSFIFIVPVLGLVSSCNPTEITGTGVKSNVIVNDGSWDGKAYVYQENPTILAGKTVPFSSVNISKYLDRSPAFITDNTNLTGNCTLSVMYGSNTVEECLKVRPQSTSPDIDLPRKPDRTYIYNTGSPEFYQVNALYHASKGANKFFDKLAWAFNVVRGTTLIPKSIPYYLKDTEMFWLKAVQNAEAKQFQKSFLTIYSQCDFEANAFFDPAGPSMCLGTIDAAPNFNVVQDPSIIYHELGHALVSVMLNLRNGTRDMYGNYSYHPLRSNLGSYGYDEAGSINEGLADYYSYVMRNRETIGEFGLTPINAVRPLSESAPGHITGISESSEGRLSYPQYLLYNPNSPDDPVEDVHYAGGIMTHYLVALTKSLKNECSLTSEADGGHDVATSYVMLVLAESLSELGDLKAKGIDLSSGFPFTDALYFNNLDETNSYLWNQVVNPVSYRRFMQVFSKNLYKYVTKSLCPSFDKTDSEKLLDDYGLLLFKTYNNNGNSTKDRTKVYSNVTGVGSFSSWSTSLLSVAEDNRRKSVLISKNLIDLAAKTDAFPDRVGFYIIDSPNEIQDFLNALLFKGYTVPFSTNVAGTVYNNSNVKVSPGEIVGVIPNLVNNSNSVMAGVQLLANDWDHVHITDTASGNFKPCVLDATTTVDQGGEAGNTCTSTQMSYTRLLKNSSGQFPTEAAAPVCLVQLEEGDSTRWVSQNEFRKKQGLSLLDKDCLGYSANGSADTDFTFNQHECLARFLPGANDASFSKIDPQKTYYESVIKDSEAGIFNAGNLLLLEVNKWVPPGTKFRCRMRARFSNCSDCYTDGTNSNDDFIDGEFNGSKPFKVINFEFDVND